MTSFKINKNKKCNFYVYNNISEQSLILWANLIMLH